MDELSASARSDIGLFCIVEKNRTRRRFTLPLLKSLVKGRAIHRGSCNRNITIYQLYLAGTAFPFVSLLEGVSVHLHTVRNYRQMSVLNIESFAKPDVIIVLSPAHSMIIRVPSGLADFEVRR